MQTVLLFIFILSVVVLVHELGHLVFAKRAGMLVREFAIGFGPKLFSKVKGETLYSVRALPLGGFIKIADEDSEVVELERGTEGIAPIDHRFDSITTKQKAMAILAGPLFNIIFTVVLFVIFVAMTGVNQHVIVDKLGLENQSQTGPAVRAGIKQGDIITAVDGKEIDNPIAFSSCLLEAKGREVIVSVLRDGQKMKIPVTPVKKGNFYQIGIYLKEVKRPATSAWEAVTEGVEKTFESGSGILDGFGKLITGQIPLSSLGGPFQMGSITGKAAEGGIESLIGWTALLSLNLGIFNLLPIPALDGGRLVFIWIERIRRRPIEKEGYVHFVGFALLMVLMLVVTFNDIKRIFI